MVRGDIVYNSDHFFHGFKANHAIFWSWRHSDVIMGMQPEPVQEEIANDDVLVMPEGPLNRARAKKLKEALTGMLKSIEKK